jgi:hypothetical protein
MTYDHIIAVLKLANIPLLKSFSPNEYYINNRSIVISKELNIIIYKPHNNQNTVAIELNNVTINILYNIVINSEVK